MNPARPAHRLASLAALALATPMFLLVSSPTARADEASFLRAWESIRGDAIARHVEELASDAYLGRAPGTEGETKAVAYVQAAFERAGAVPGATGGGWLQDVPLVEVRPVAGSSSVTLHDAKGKAALAIGKEVFVRMGRPGTGAKLKGVPLVFAGYGITAPEEQWDDYAGIDVKGAAVILLKRHGRFQVADNCRCLDKTLLRIHPPLVRRKVFRRRKSSIKQ